MPCSLSSTVLLPGTTIIKNIDSIHHHWQQYHTIMQAFKNDEISIQTVYTRLKRLQESSADLKNKIARLEPHQDWKMPIMNSRSASSRRPVIM